MINGESGQDLEFIAGASQEAFTTLELGCVGGLDVYLDR